jgi:hypothetical protein
MEEDTFCYIGLSLMILMFRLPWMMKKKKEADEEKEWKKREFV